MYRWRRLSDEERVAVAAERRHLNRPSHSPLHFDSGAGNYLITAACFEHRPVIGFSPERLADFSQQFCNTLAAHSERVSAWVVLPNHYHALVRTSGVLKLLRALGRLHGRTSFAWNGEESARGRQVWCNATERVMRSDRHYWATLNYVHHNPVKHGLTKQWLDWPWSSAAEYLREVGRDEAERIWREHPIDRYGRGWDE